METRRPPVTARVAEELDLLRAVFPGVVYEQNGHWFMIPEYPLNGGPSWMPRPLAVAFHAQPGHPGQAPYGIWVPAGVRVQGQAPNNIQDPANQQPPFSGRWALLSWTVEDNQWRPKAEVAKGSNLLNYALGFQQRFEQGR